MPRIFSCDKHDGTIVSYVTDYRDTGCPVCGMSDEIDSLTGALERETDKLNAAQSYAEELADELARYNLPVNKLSEGRHFREDS